MIAQTADRPIRKFNPGTFQSDEEITEQFVVRKRELGVLLEVLRGNIESPSCQHALIVAPRGRGKTMLLARAAAEIRKSPELAPYLLPVRFMEESHEIFSLTDFWLETLFHLARECLSRDAQLAEELRDRHVALSERWREQPLEDHARAAVLDAADRLGRKLVLMVENFQSLSEDVDGDFGWKLRGVLQTEPQIMLLASATSRFAVLDDAEQPYFEMFRFINLKPMTIEECRSLWQVVSGDRVSGRRMRPLEILTGGNPRLLVIVAGFSRHKSLRRLMEELVMLIDEHTEYFRGHLEVLGKSERRAYIAALDLWQPSTPSEIAARARMDARVASTMLKRLLDRGALVFEGSSKKRKYVAAEPLYCIYYKLRRGRGEAAIVENLIRFMSVFYSEAERTEMFPSLISEGADSATIRQGFDMAAAGLPEFAKFLAASKVARLVDIKPDRGVLGDLRGSAAANVPDYDLIERILEEISVASNERAFETVIDIVDRFMAVQGPASHRIARAFEAWAINTKGDAHAELGNLEAAFSAYDQVVDRFSTDRDVHLKGLVARALVSTGDLSREAGNPGPGLSAYAEVVERFGDSEDSWPQGWVARAITHKGHVLWEMGDLDSAQSAYEEVVERFHGSDHQESQRRVADSLVGQGYLKEQLGKPELALAAYEEVVERFGASDDIELQRSVARSLTCMGYVRRDLGDPTLARLACEEVTKRFSSSTDMELKQRIAEALTLKADMSQARDDLTSAVLALDEILERFENEADLELQRWVAKALTSKGYIQAEQGDFESAISTYGEIIQRFGTSGQIEMEACTSAALHRKGKALLDLGDPESALEAFDEFLERFGSGEHANLHEWIAKTLVNKGDALRKLDQLDLAVSAYRQVVERFGSSEDTRVLWWVSGALAYTGRALRKANNLDGALAAFDEAVKRFGNSEAPELRQWVALTRIEQAEMLTSMGCIEEALQICNEFEPRIRGLDSDRERELTCRAREIWTRALLARQELPAAMDMFRSMLEAFMPGDEAMIREAVELVSELVAGGAAANDLLETLSSDRNKADTLAPLLIALRQHAGESVRAPRELLDVAEDIRAQIQEKIRHGTDSA